MSVDNIDIHSRVMRRVLVISYMRRLQEPMIGSLFMLGIALAFIFSAVHAFDVLANALQLPTLFDSSVYMLKAALAADHSIQMVLAVALASALYILGRCAFKTLKVVYRSLVWTQSGLRKAAASLLFGRTVIG
jgi:hypothetical protein